MKNIVIIGGGTGTFTLLSGLRKFPTNNSVIVSTADNGGSGGKLRYELGVIPPGDYRQCLLGLSYTDEDLKEMFAYRFSEGSLSGHTVGNIIIAALEKTTGNIEKAIEVAGKILNIRGAVLPVTLKPTELIAILQNGKKIKGEHNIDQSRKVEDLRFKIKDLRLKPNGPANPKALEALKKADVIVLGPGDLYTSILPNLLVKGIKEAIDASRAKKVLVTSLMTKAGQTDGFFVKDFIQVTNKYLGKKKLNAVIVNSKKPAAGILAKYKKENAKFIELKTEGLKALKIEVVTADLLSGKVYAKVKGDSLERSSLRHDSDKLAKIIYEL